MTITELRLELKEGMVNAVKGEMGLDITFPIETAINRIIDKYVIELI